MSTIVFHSLIRRFTGDKSITVTDAKTVGGIIDILTERYGEGLRSKLISPDGEIGPYISIFLNDKDVRTLDGLPTPIHEEDQLILLPTATGG